MDLSSGTAEVPHNSGMKQCSLLEFQHYLRQIYQQTRTEMNIGVSLSEKQNEMEMKVIGE
jgi:hypothetical protein